jgi:hypothetical protein
MARPSNSFDSVSMTIAITPQIKMYLEDLMLTGMYGCSPAEAARILLSQAVVEKVKSGEIDRRKFALDNNDIVPVT